MKWQLAGLVLLSIGMIALPLVLLADWLTPGTAPGIGWMQLVASVPALLTIGAGAALTSRRTPASGTQGRKLTLSSGIITAFCAIVLVAAIFEPGRVFPYDRTTGVWKVYDSVKSIGLSNTAICRCSPDETVRVVLPGGFTTRVSLYDRGGHGQRPGVVIGHGNTWLGGGLSTYRLLASNLAKRNYVVASVDFPGFGEADDPFGRGPAGVADAYDRPAQLGAVVDWLIANTDVDPSNITLFGHSGGVDWAMRTGKSHPNVARIAVMIAPNPPAIENDLAENTAEYETARAAYFSQRFAKQYEFVHGRKVPDWYRWELAHPNGRFSDDVFSLYAPPGHRPLMVILGERDAPAGHASVRKRFGSVSEPKALMLLRHSDHYLNSAQSLGLVFYDLRVARQLVGELSSWIDRVGP